MARRSTVVTGVLLVLGLSGCGTETPDPGLLGAVTGRPADACTTLGTLLSETGVARDHQPTASPRELARASDAVLRGELTGQVLPVRGDGDVFVDLEVDVTEVVLGEELQGTPEPSRLRLVVAPDRLPDAARTVPALVGTDVVAFVEVQTDTTGSSQVTGDGAAPVAAPLPAEGLMTGCGDRLAGWAGTGEAWSLASLDEVALAALGSPAEVVALQGPWVTVSGDDALEVSRGPEHCGWEGAMTAGLWPSGRLFVRDPEAVLPPTAEVLDTDAAPPEGDASSSWRQDDDAGTLRAVLGDGDGALGVQLADGRWERWPEVVPAVGCA